MSRFKKDQGELVERVIGSIVYDKKTGFYSIFMQLKATKNTIFSGLLLPNKSSIRPMLNKKESPILLVFSLL